MSTLTVFAVGGAGINTVDSWISTGQSQRLSSGDLNFVGIDTSTNNVPKTSKFVVEHMEGARGGGKNRAKNYPGALPFIDELLSRHKPGDYVIIVYSTAGATGGLFGPLLARRLLERGIPTYNFVIGDLASQKEIDNTAKVFKTLDNQRQQLDVNVVFDYIRNDRFPNRGEANKAVVQRLDYASLFLTDEHEEADFEDTKNLFFVNRETNTPASLVKANFFIDPENLNEEAGSAVVAAMSLYRDGNSITSDLGTLAYRVTGVISPDMGPKSAKSFHMTLDQGETVRELQQLLADAADRETQSKQRFRQNESLSTTGGDDNGVEL